MMFAQLSNRVSLRDLIVALEAHNKKLYHLGLGKNVLSDSTIELTGYYPHKYYPEPFRLVRYWDEEQELLNAVYHGTFVTAAKKIFSKTKGKGVIQGKDYMSGSPLRQDYLETVLDWIRDGDIANYMSAHRHDTDTDELYKFFLEVINWIPTVYNKNRKEMKNVNWGKLYKYFGAKTYNADDMETKVKELMKDSDVSNKSSIYSYLLDNREAHLSLRAFDDNTKREIYEQQNGKCAICGNDFKIEEMEADYIIPWSQGGKTFLENCQMLCRTCSRQKGSKLIAPHSRKIRVCEVFSCVFIFSGQQ